MEIVAPAPKKIDTTYDGNNQWITNTTIQSKNSWIEADTWLKKDDSNNPKYLQVKSIKYTDTEDNETNLGTDTSKIKEAGTYEVTVAMKNIRWKDGENRTTGDKTFIINVAQKPVGTLNPTVDTSGTNYAGTSSGNSETEGGFPAISLPDGWSIPGTIKWDDNQTLGETGDYNWTFTPDDANYDVKTGSSQIVVTPVSISAISATLPASAGNVYTSTTLASLLSKLTLTKTYNNATDPVPASSSEVQWVTGTKLEAGENKELTLELKSNSSVTCKVTIPKILAVVPAELIVTLKEGSTVYTSTSLDDLKTMLTVEEKNNDGSPGETLTADKFTLPENLNLTDGTNTITVTHVHSEDVTVTGDVTITVANASVKSVKVTPNVPEGVTLWEGAAANTIKQYLTVEVTFLDGHDTKKTLDYTKDNFTVNVVGSSDNLLTPGQCAFTVTYSGKTSTAQTVTVTELLVDTLTATYVQAGRTIYSSATVADLQVDTYLSVNAVFNNGDEETLESSEYTVTLPKDFSSTNNTVTVTWKKGSTTKTATFTVTVTDRDVSGVTAEYSAPDGKNPTAVSSLDDLKNGLTVKLTYNDGGEPKTLKATEYTLVADENGLQENGNLNAGTRTITVKYNDDIYTTVEVTVDKAAVEIGGTSFTPTGGGESGGSGKLEPDGNGGFKGTYDPEGGYDVGIDPEDLPDGVTPKKPVYKKYTGDGKPEFNTDGSPKDPTKWKPVDKIDGAGDYIVEIDFDYDDDNFDEIPPVSTIVNIGKADVDMGGTEVKPTGADSGLKPAADGGFTGTYKPDGNYGVGIDPDSIPDNVTPKTPVYKKYTGDGKPEFNSDGTPAEPEKWVNVTKPDGAGDYIYVVEFEPKDKENYNEIDPVVVVLTLSDKEAVSIAATLEEGAAFTTANTLDELKAKLTATVTYDNGDEEQVKVSDLDITCNGLRDGNKFKAGVQSVTVKFTDEGGNEVSTAVNITVQKVKVAVPAFKGGLSYTGAPITIKTENFTSFDDALMTMVADKTLPGKNAGTYKAVFALIDPENYEWATANTVSKKVFAAAVYDGEMPLSAHEVAVDWNIARAVITATKKDGALPEFASESFMGALADVVTLKYYTDETCTEEVAADQLAYSKEYYVKAALLDEDNFELDASAEQYRMKAFTYTTPAKELTGFEKVLAVAKANWLWIVIAAVALILLILIIALAVRAAKKKRIREEQRLEKEERKEEERRLREEERRREDREERMARMSQQQTMPPMMMPQMMQMPQMSQQMPQSMPQQAQPMAAGGSSNEIAELKAEMAAMKAEQAAKEIAALRAEAAAKALTDQQIAQSKLETQFATLMARMGGEQVAAGGVGGVTLQALTELIRTEVRNAMADEKSAQSATAAAKPESAAAPAATQVPPDAVMTTVTTTKIDTTKKQAQTAPQAQAAPATRTVVRNFVAPMPVDDGRVFDVGGFYTPADPITDMGFTDDENKD
ncbi:MAG: hypothetical protein K2O44_01505 [Clostridia bacterium]|nr:hypothetical protein [Clostridia bacterium]